MNQNILPRTIGFDGADSVNKTRFAVLTLRMLEKNGQEALFCPLPKGGTITSGLIDKSKRLSVPQEAMFPLYATNRAEILPVINQWLLEGENRWVVFDRTKESGEAYARALGETNVEWLRALDMHFPDVKVGLYLSRPVEESMEIMKRKGRNISAVKQGLDRNLSLQVGVREIFEEIVQKRENWHEIDVSGLAFEPREFYEWEIKVGKQVWETVCTQLNRPEWMEGAEEIIRESSMGIFVTEGVLQGRLEDRFAVASREFYEGRAAQRRRERA